MSTRAMITLPKAESDLLMLPASCECVRRREGGRKEEGEREGGRKEEGEREGGREGGRRREREREEGRGRERKREGEM